MTLWAEDEALEAARRKLSLKLPQGEEGRSGFAGKTYALAATGDGDADLSSRIILLVKERSGIAARAGAVERCGLVDLRRCRRAGRVHCVARCTRLGEVCMATRPLLRTRCKCDRAA